MVPDRARGVLSRLAHASAGRLGRVARRTFLALDPGVRDLYLENFAVMPLALQRRLLRRRDLLDGRDPYAEAIACYDRAPGGILDRLSRTDLDTYLVELLMKQDQMSMAASIESRVPFLDDRLVAHVAAMPGSLKVSGWHTKVVLREAVKDLVPPAILSRPKMGFPTPLGKWFRNGLSPVVDEFVLGPRVQARGFFDHGELSRLAAEHRSGRADHTDRLWLLVNLEIWLRMYADGEHFSDVMRPVERPQAKKVHANSLGQDERPLAVDDRRASSKPADPVPAL
jgi:asparagine synthase (glutamine-hydrolysing)